MQSQDQITNVQGAARRPKGCYVMLHIGSSPSFASEVSSPVVVADGRSRFDLSDDVWIERLDEELAKHIQTACEPSHYKIDKISRDLHSYAFVRWVPDLEKTKYEGMVELFALAALSRLVHPTSIGSRYCALVFNCELKESTILAIQFGGISPDVALGENNPRDWLTVEDGEILRKLMRWLPRDKVMLGRVHRAYWYHEYAMRSYYLDARWPLVVSGFEALVITRDKRVTKQFCLRVGQLAAQFSVALTQKEIKNAYRLRSKLVHAQDFLFGLQGIVPQSQHKALYEKLESLLRLTVKTCLLDDTFAANFRDRAAVESRWPVSIV